jgi:hypothetical protein
MTTLEISANVKFASLEEARVAGQAIEQFLSIKGKNGVRLYSFEQNEDGKRPSRNTHPLYLPDSDRSKVTRGQQEVETRLMNLVKNIHAAVPVIPVGAELKEAVMVLDGKQWGINYQQLFDNVAVHADKAEVKEAFNSAVALTLQQEVTGRIR